MNSTEGTADKLSDSAVVQRAVAERLLRAVATIGDSAVELADRRRALLGELSDVVQADFGFWSWGRGWPGVETMSPVAIIDFGFSDSQRGVVIEWGLSADTDRNFRQPIMARMGQDRRATNFRREIFPDAIWETCPTMRQRLASGGWESWLHSVQYSDNDTWSNLFLLRNIGKKEFGANEAAIVDCVLNGVPWLHSKAEEFLPPEAFAGLTARQRTVMLLLLDGLARKAIARQLSISEDTVGDHIKSIYNHLSVGSASELAALFLRGR
jgi:DNA-binding CsgD family transcriptional regulator